MGDHVEKCKMHGIATKPCQSKSKIRTVHSNFAQIDTLVSSRHDMQLQKKRQQASAALNNSSTARSRDCCALCLSHPRLDSANQPRSVLVTNLHMIISCKDRRSVVKASCEPTPSRPSHHWKCLLCRHISSSQPLLFLVQNLLSVPRSRPLAAQEPQWPLAQQLDHWQRSPWS